jgi:hypothetical protein
MKRYLLLFMVLILNYFSYSQKQYPCDTSLWQHVYHKQRLEVKQECKTVTGYIFSKKKEPDGDIHIKLRLDAGQGDLLNNKNIEKEDSCLVIEPICAGRATQPDAIGSCKDYVNQIEIPKKGQHVRITGSYVLDTKHGWLEIHPITKIEVIP